MPQLTLIFEDLAMFAVTLVAGVLGVPVQGLLHSSS
jgi:hypothetical protein